MITLEPPPYAGLNLSVSDLLLASTFQIEWYFYALSNFLWGEEQASKGTQRKEKPNLCVNWSCLGDFGQLWSGMRLWKILGLGILGLPSWSEISGRRSFLLLSSLREARRFALSPAPPLGFIHCGIWFSNVFPLMVHSCLFVFHMGFVDLRSFSFLGFVDWWTRTEGNYEPQVVEASQYC